MKPALADKVVFITGASSGIGEALAREAAAQGAAVVLCARRYDRVAALAATIEATGGRALAIRCDVTRDGQLDSAVQESLARFGRLDMVVANAGFSVNGAIADLHLDDYRRQLETNFFGLIRTIQAALPALRASRGSIGLQGSTNGYLSLPGYSAYCASKHAVRSLADCLRHELAGQGISVTHLAPGFVHSEIRLLDKNGQRRTDARDPIPAWLQIPTEKAARRMLRAITSRRAETIISLHSRLGIFSARHVPWLVSVALRAARGALMSAARQS